VAIRAKKGRPDAMDIPIIMMTADVFADDRVDLLRAGANDFIYKPVEIDALYNTLYRYIKPNRKVKENNQ
jgi:DNA-binding response OmpR family regulator